MLLTRPTLLYCFGPVFFVSAPTDVSNDVVAASAPIPASSVPAVFNGIGDVMSVEMMLLNGKLEYDFDITLVKTGELGSAGAQGETDGSFSVDKFVESVKAGEVEVDESLAEFLINLLDGLGPFASYPWCPSNRILLVVTGFIWLCVLYFLLTRYGYGNKDSDNENRTGGGGNITGGGNGDWNNYNWWGILLRPFCSYLKVKHFFLQVLPWLCRGGPEIFYVIDILLVLTFLVIGLGYPEMAYCVGTGSGVEIGTQAFAQFLQIPFEDSRAILFADWQHLETIVQTCQTGKLPSAGDCFELVQQLQPTQLDSLINSISLRSPMVTEEKIQEWGRLSVQLKASTNTLFRLFQEQLVPGLKIVTGLSIPLSMPMEESIDLLFQLRISPETQAYYASQMLYHAQPLLGIYNNIFGLLPSNSEVMFVEPVVRDIPNINLGRWAPRSEAISIQAIHARFRRDFQIALRFHRLRDQIRKGTHHRPKRPRNR